MPIKIIINEITINEIPRIPPNLINQITYSVFPLSSDVSPLVNRADITGTGSIFLFYLTFTSYIKLEGSTLQFNFPRGGREVKVKVNANGFDQRASRL